MSPSAYLRATLLAGATLGAAGALRAQSVVSDVNNYASSIGGYNLITLGNTTLDGSSDTQGAIAVGGNLTFGGTWTIASNNGTGNSNPSLYVNGSMTLSGTEQLNNGFASTPNVGSGYTWNSGSEDFSNSDGTLHINASGSHDTTSPISNPTPGWNWSTVASNYDSISSSLAAATTSGTVSASNNELNFTTSVTSGVAVFDLDAADLSGDTYNGVSFSSINIDVPAGVDYVINVLNLCDGQTLFGSGVNFNSNGDDDQLLWNFDQSTNITVSLGGNFYGSILAPNVNITDDTTINGTVVADSFTDDGVELHDSDDFVSVVVPEPRTFALWAVGLCGAAVLVGRRLRRPLQAA